MALLLNVDYRWATREVFCNSLAHDYEIPAAPYELRGDTDWTPCCERHLFMWHAIDADVIR